MGLAYLAAVLEKNKIQVEILDANVLDLSPAEVADYARGTKADIVGISILTPAHNFATEVSSLLPKGIISVAGGPQASALPEELLQEGFEVVIKGEGEQSLLEIAQGKDFQDILGISFKRGNRNLHNRDRPFLDPDELPLPARHLLIRQGCNRPYFSEGTRYFPWARIHSSRGCPWDCYYCHKSVFGYNFRPRSPQGVLREVEYLVKNFGVKEIDFSDDVFNLDIKRAEEILEGIIRARFRLCLRFSNGLRIDRINQELLKKMKLAGTEYIAYGIESGDREILDRIPKQIRLEQVREVVRLTRKTGIKVTGFFMLGLIGDSRQSMHRTVEFARGLGLDAALFNIAIPYPGTKMYQHIKETGEILVRDWSQFYHTSGKMIYTLDGTSLPQEVERFYRRANRRFYLRPGYIFKEVSDAIFNRKLSPLWRGARRVIYSQKR
jgi:radical SAM superfamily enzyme YgiQ (UPF0313 family)